MVRNRTGAKTFVFCSLLYIWIKELLFLRKREKSRTYTWVRANPLQVRRRKEYIFYEQIRKFGKNFHMTFEVAGVPHCVVRLINDVMTALWTDYLNPFHAYDEGNLSWLVNISFFSEIFEVWEFLWLWHYVFVLLCICLFSFCLLYIISCLLMEFSERTTTNRMMYVPSSCRLLSTIYELFREPFGCR